MTMIFPSCHAQLPYDTEESKDFKNTKEIVIDHDLVL